MHKVKFTVPGIDGNFEADADELHSYRTIKQLALADEDLPGMLHALERIYMGKDVEYVDRMGGLDGLGKLNDAAVEAARVKNS